MASPSDIALLERWRQHRDAEAFRELVVRHAAMVHATCLRILGNEENARDVAQECFLRLAQENLRIRSSLGGFLHRLARNSSLNWLRSETRRRTRERKSALSPPRLTDPSWDDVQRHIDEAIDRLPEEVREVIVARYLEQESIQSIAEHLDLSRREVSYRAEKGIAAIRRQLRSRGIGLGAGALAILLLREGAPAAPAPLVRALGKRALAGKVQLGLASVTTLGMLGGTLIMNMKMIGVGAMVLLALAGGWWLLPNRERTPTRTRSGAASTSATRAVETARPGGELASPGEKAQLQLRLRWAHSGSAVRHGEVTLADSTRGGESIRGTADEGGSLTLEHPADWASARLEARHSGAETVVEELPLPHLAVKIIELSAVHALAGQVRSRGSDEPIADAQVRFSPNPTSPWRSAFDATTTDGRGAYELLLPESGQHSVLFSAEGHADEVVEVEATERGWTELNVELEPAFELHVRVVDGAGAVLEGVRVTPSLFAADFWGGGGPYDDRNSVFTDALGRAIVPRVRREHPQPFCSSSVVTYGRRCIPTRSPVTSRRSRRPWCSRRRRALRNESKATSRTRTESPCKGYSCTGGTPTASAWGRMVSGGPG